MNYEKDIEIDETDLAVECLNQASLMMRYTKHQARCEKERDLLKESLGLIKAELDNKIRTNPEKYKLEKITEGAITAIILQRNEYKVINNNYLEKCYECNVASGAVKSVDQRKKMLELLVQLHGQQYFAGPSIPHNLTERREQKQKKVDDGIASKIQRKRNK